LGLGQVGEAEPVVIPLGVPNIDIDGLALGSDFMRRWRLS
jgi:hypothetical protein